MAKAEKEKIITELSALGVDFNPGLSEAKLKDLLTANQTNAVSIIKDADKLDEKEVTELSQLMGMLSTVIKKIDNIDSRVDKIETGGREDFKKEAVEKDIEKAGYNKATLDPKVVNIVEETLGVDFGIELESFDDKPGFLFTLVVPKRLSDLPESQRPVMDSETGKYKIQKDGGPYDYVMESYQPQDRRSKQVGSGQSYDSIRDHCNRVRSYIVSYYQKMKKPLPEFKLK